MTSDASYRRFAVYMDTVISIQVAAPSPHTGVEARVDRALGWFRHVEAVCSRFDDRSEVCLLRSRVGTPVAASPVLRAA